MKYLHQHIHWTSFTWDDAIILPLLGEVRFAQGRLLGQMDDLGFNLKTDAELSTLTSEVAASSRIEGVTLDAAKVRSSVSRQLGLAMPDPAPDTHDVDGAVQIVLDATLHYDKPLSRERLQKWHTALFPTGYSGLSRIRVGRYRTQEMQIVSGPIGRENIHYIAPAPGDVEGLMDDFIAWFNSEERMEPLVKAGVAHLWFLTIHPFDDGNGRLARALTELLLARSDHTPRRFYSMAHQILADRETYYTVLERTQKGSGDLTAWLTWFLQTLRKSIDQSALSLQEVLDRSAFWKRMEGVALNERQRSMLARLKGDFRGKLTAKKWATMCKVSPDTALRDINDLMDKGILKRDAAGGRSTAYLLADSLDLSSYHPE